MGRIGLRKALSRSIFRTLYAPSLSLSRSISPLVPDIFLSSSLPPPSAIDATPPSISTPHAGNTSVISVSPRGFSIISRNCCSCRKRERWIYRYRTAAEKDRERRRTARLATWRNMEIRGTEKTGARATERRNSIDARCIDAVTRGGRYWKWQSAIVGHDGGNGRQPHLPFPPADFLVRSRRSDSLERRTMTFEMS